jgi:spermidine synthase
MLAARRTAGAPPLQAEIVGLGPGAMACLAAEAVRLTFIEIDPGVVDAANNQFTYLSRCGSTAVKVGDGRIILSRQRDSSLDVIAMDAFSSDSVPAHLITSDAFGVYWRKLRAGGVIAVHISNRYLDLAPVIAAGAAANGATAYRYEAVAGGVPSVWTAMTRDPELAAKIVIPGASFGITFC